LAKKSKITGKPKKKESTKKKVFNKKTHFLWLLGQHIKSLREKKKLTQLDLGSYVNKDRQSIQRLEVGNVNPTINYLREIAEGLEVPLKKLMDFKMGD
jgi:DNA-binding XRE family transcriptional regulator